MDTLKRLTLTPLRVVLAVAMLPIALLSLVILFFTFLMLAGAVVAVVRAVWP